MTPEPVLGKLAYYYSLFDAGIHAQGMTVARGATIYGVFVYTDKLTMAQLVSLEGLAEKL
jgi:hypothetical protein